MTSLDTRQLLAAHPWLSRPTAGTFGEEELDGLPEPVQRYFRAAVAPGSRDRRRDRRLILPARPRQRRLEFITRPS